MVQTFGKYSLIHRIAVGGMAEIFVARSRGMEGFSKTVVIKRIRPHLSEKTAFVNMFLNEAKLAAELTHSNIAQIFDLGRIDDCYFIAMEYVHGRDMRTIVPKTEKMGIEFPLEYSLKIASSVCEGLYYAHRKTDEENNPLHIVHRDVTPENIMVSFDGEVKILDFGIAKAENLVSDTRAGEIKGKLGYLSPEQVTGKVLDHRSDIFSLGVVLYEWVTGHKLFAGSSDVEVLRNVVEGRIYPPSYFKEDIPEPVERILMRTLERNREERYQSAWEMQYDINRFFKAHEFTPTNIHLSNFIRQMFARELAEDAKRLKQRPPEDEQAGEVDAYGLPPVPGEAGAPDNGAIDRSELGTMLVDTSGPPEDRKSEAGGPRRHTRAEKPVSLGPRAEDAADPDPLEAELLARRDGYLSLALEIKRDDYDRLRAVAERHRMTVTALIRDVLEQLTKYM